VYEVAPDGKTFAFTGYEPPADDEKNEKQKGAGERSLVKVYLDACCLSRLTDDQSQARIREEADAIEHRLSQVHLGTADLISSEALEDEARRNPSVEWRLEVEALLSLASTAVELDDALAQRAVELRAAEAAGADVLLSMDDRLIQRAARGIGHPQIPVRNPLSWNKEQAP
jgi:hypothetical protein